MKTAATDQGVRKRWIGMFVSTYLPGLQKIPENYHPNDKIRGVLDKFNGNCDNLVHKSEIRNDRIWKVLDPKYTIH